MEPDNSETPKWLRKIQENSWEAEILISGGAIFSLFQIKMGLLGLYIYLKGAWTFAGLDEGLLLAIVASKGLTVGFITHLILRAYWISLNCIQFAFKDKGDVRIESLHQKIIALDKTAGLFFATSICFVIFIIGLYLLVIPLPLMRELDESNFLFIAVVILEGVFLIDVLSSEKLRNLKYLKLLKYPFWVLDRLSLAFLYARPMMATFQNFGLVKSIMIASTFLLITLLFSFNDAHRALGIPTPFDKREFSNALSKYRNYSPYHYESESDGSTIQPQIQSPIISDNFLKIRVGYGQWNDQFINEKGVTTYAELLEVQLNDSIIKDVKWLGMQPKIDDSDYAVIAFLDIRLLAQGEHLLILRRFQNSQMKTIAEIPFWKNN